MRILMPNHFQLPGIGMGIYTLNDAGELIKAGHEILVIAPNHTETSVYPWSILPGPNRLRI